MCQQPPGPRSLPDDLVVFPVSSVEGQKARQPNCLPQPALCSHAAPAGSQEEEKSPRHGLSGAWQRESRPPAALPCALRCSSGASGLGCWGQPSWDRLPLPRFLYEAHFCHRATSHEGSPPHKVPAVESRAHQAGQMTQKHQRSTQCTTQHEIHLSEAAVPHC